MIVERIVTPVGLPSVPLGGLAYWDCNGTRCLGVRVSLASSQQFEMLELSPLDDTGFDSPALQRVDDPDAHCALHYGHEYFIDYDASDAVQITLGDVDHKAWRVVVSGDSAYLMIGSAVRGRASFDLASGLMTKPGLGPKFAVDRWRIVRGLPSGEREVIFKRGE
ncbi:hypothetical protein [Reyranella sp.]|uniref:hypothetical protein n=1 Tax=Reyranella sp. TaxID=1929291 RepID=UPI004035152A